MPEIEDLIGAKGYCVLHAPRQTGKTTSLLALMDHVNKSGQYRACYANIEDAQGAQYDLARGLRTVCAAIETSASQYLGEHRLHGWTQDAWQAADATGALRGLLERWSQNSDRPVVLMLDEVDALVGDTLISVLRQIRAGYAQRPGSFPQTVILCGLRDVRDYRIQTSRQEIITGGFAFNIKAKSLRLGNFTREETEALWRQHQDETGQVIDPAIYPKLWDDTEGQPWLVNALGYEVTWEDRELRDRRQPITLERYFEARERLIQSRATHLDHLTEKLREPRVIPIISDILQGKTVATNYPADDLRYVEDLGLIATRPHIRIANRIYTEVIPRELTWPTQQGLTQQTVWYVRPDGRLDFPKLFAAFQECFRENSESWLGSEAYREAGAQLLLQTFLHRIMNGGGRIVRALALGTQRVDLGVTWPLDPGQRFHGPTQKVAIEIKVVRGHDGLDSTLARGMEQVAGYASQMGADESYLVIFDQRPHKTWQERIWHRVESHAGRAIGVWGV